MEDLGWRPMSYGGTTGLSQVSQVETVDFCLYQHLDQTLLYRVTNSNKSIWKEKLTNEAVQLRIRTNSQLI